MIAAIKPNIIPMTESISPTEILLDALLAPVMLIDVVVDDILKPLLDTTDMGL